MSAEIEIKFLVSPEAKEQIETHFLPSIDGVIAHAQNDLLNHYYDTANGMLRNAKCGLRVRGKNGEFEQTLKTQGESIGGIQNRPEYNVPLHSDQLDVHLFDASCWPASISVETLATTATVQFTTHFSRDAYFITLQDGAEIEMVFDLGNVAADGQSVNICEIEIELISGEITSLLSLARDLVQHIEGRFGYLSKAARGYHLLSHTVFEPKASYDFIKLEASDDVSTALKRTLASIIEDWQYHEECYVQKPTASAVLAIARSIDLLHYTCETYGDLLNSQWLRELAGQTKALQQQWQWFNELHVVKTLTSTRGLFYKTLAKYPQFSAYLAGRKAGLLGEANTKHLVYSHEKNKLQFKVLEGIITMPWQPQNSNDDSLLAQHASNQLNHQWQAVFTCFNCDTPLNAEQLASQYHPLSQAYLAGVLFAELFNQQARDEFRAPWLDILSGIEELHVLTGLQVEIRQSDIEGLESLNGWIVEKIERLLPILEHTRDVAKKSQSYW